MHLYGGADGCKVQNKGPFRTQKVRLFHDREPKMHSLRLLVVFDYVSGFSNTYN
jgi:hypothetical protein